MKTETEIKVQGMQALHKVLGDVDAERFVTAIIREPFDYTDWRKGLWVDRTIDEIHTTAIATRKVLRKSRRQA